MLNQSLGLSHKGEQWTGQHWIFWPSMDSPQSVASVCQLQMSCHVTSWHRDILMTSQTQTSSSTLGKNQVGCKFKSGSEGVMMIVYRVTRSWLGMMILLVFYCPRSLRLFTVHQGPVYAGQCCNWTLWPPISEYHRDHDRHTSTRPSSVFSVWRYNDQSDTNTNNDSSDQATEGQGRPVILTNCHSQHKQCASITYIFVWEFSNDV